MTSQQSRDFSSKNQPTFSCVLIFSTSSNTTTPTPTRSSTHLTPRRSARSQAESAVDMQRESSSSERNFTSSRLVHFAPALLEFESPLTSEHFVIFSSSPGPSRRQFLVGSAALVAAS